MAADSFQDMAPLVDSCRRHMPTWQNLPIHTYLVGGAVRDKLLGRAVVDHDHVVVGALPEELLALGYRPVGKDFPVFLHPQTGEEYALARTAQKLSLTPLS